MTDRMMQLVNEFRSSDTAEFRRNVGVQIAELYIKEQETPAKGNSLNFGPGIWNQRRAKFDSSCSKCGTFLEIGTVCWVTTGESPRCVDCGKP